VIVDAPTLSLSYQIALSHFLQIFLPLFLSFISYLQRFKKH
jgi:hypothetical protein